MELCRRIVLALALSGAVLLVGLPGLRAGEEAGARSPEPVSYTHLTLPTTPYV